MTRTSNPKIILSFHFELWCEWSVFVMVKMNRFAVYWIVTDYAYKSGNRAAFFFFFWLWKYLHSWKKTELDRNLHDVFQIKYLQKKKKRNFWSDVPNCTAVRNLNIHRICAQGLCILSAF
jgi:hypothetical protein